MTRSSTIKDLRRVKGADVLTKDELAKAEAMFDAHKGAPSFAAKMVYEVLIPNAARINAKLGLDCDPWDLAYAIEYNLFKGQKRKSPSK